MDSIHEKAEGLTLSPPLEIAPDGDVILVVGEDRVHLKVDSHCLRSASKVFRTMFGPNWHEGQDLTTKSPKCINLDEDDSDALRTICGVIHHQQEPQERVPGPRQILQIAVLSDKYQLNVALSYAATSWMGRRNGKISMPMVERMYLLASAYLFQARDVFKEIAQELVLGHQGSFLGLIEDGAVMDVLPWELFRM